MLERAPVQADPVLCTRSWPGGHYTSVDLWGYDSYPNGPRTFPACPVRPG
jgi:hypothetical protein